MQSVDKEYKKIIVPFIIRNNFKPYHLNIYHDGIDVYRVQMKTQKTGIRKKYSRVLEDT